MSPVKKNDPEVHLQKSLDKLMTLNIKKLSNIDKGLLTQENQINTIIAMIKQLTSIEDDKVANSYNQLMIEHQKLKSDYSTLKNEYKDLKLCYDIERIDEYNKILAD